MKNLGTAVFGLGNIGVKYDLNNLSVDGVALRLDLLSENYALSVS